MAPHSWDTFGGHDGAQPGGNSLESDLLSWALQKSFVPAQAQAVLCNDQLYAPSYCQRMLLAHELWPGEQGS